MDFFGPARPAKQRITTLVLSPPGCTVQRTEWSMASPKRQSAFPDSSLQGPRAVPAIPLFPLNWIAPWCFPGCQSLPSIACHSNGQAAALASATSQILRADKSPCHKYSKKTSNPLSERCILSLLYIHSTSTCNSGCERYIPSPNSTLFLISSGS